MIMELVFLGALQATAYRPVPEQTKPACIDRHHCETANGENVSELGVAVSQDYLESGALHYGNCLYIDHVGFRIVNDCLNHRYKKRIDVFVYTRDEERKFGTRRLRVWLVKVSPEMKIAERKE